MRTRAPWLLMLVSASLLFWLVGRTGNGVGLAVTSPVRQQPAEAIPSATAASSITPTCRPVWQWVETPDHTPEPGGFSGVAAIYHNDVWATSGFFPGTAVMEHWDGQAWSFVAIPQPGQYTELRGVAALASDNIWAVGVDASASTTLIEHWDGSQWSVVPSPSPNQDSELHSVTAISADDIWAVGDTVVVTNQIGVDQTLIEHWDGTSWSVVPSPNINPSGGLQPNGLFGVAASGSNDVWVVGDYEEAQNGHIESLTEHWNGTSWSIVPAPQVDSGDQLWAVSAIAPDDAWAVGNYFSGTVHYLLALHWGGTSWQPVPVPYPDIGTNGLRGIAALASNNVWVVGDYFHQNFPNRTLVEHWDGSSWQQVPSPSDQYADVLLAISAVSPVDMWAVGERLGQYSGPGTIAEHYGCQSPTATPTAATNTPTASATSPTTATNTPSPSITLTPPNTATPSSTATPPATSTIANATNTPPATSTAASATNTPMRTATALNTATPGSTATPLPATATPTDCANPFVDISGNIFYTAIHRLNCAGVINGTDANHYSPAGTATRGQFAKIVVLGFGLPLNTPTNGQTFTDVPPGYFAYLYIESGYAAHILSGFDAASCAAAGAIYPCYLPNRAITRAQLTKLVVGAAHYPLYTPTGGQQTFSDVPPSNVFFVSIETAHAHGVVNGYPDGTFRPNNSIRRDEMAQIVYKGITSP